MDTNTLERFNTILPNLLWRFSLSNSLKLRLVAKPHLNAGRCSCPITDDQVKAAIYSGEANPIVGEQPAL